MGISYGGPIALILADIDSRVEEVVLMASSPSLQESAFPWNLLMNSGLLSWWMRGMLKREIGKSDEVRYPDLDRAYEITDNKENWRVFKKAMNHTPRERLDSMVYEMNATTMAGNTEVPEDVYVQVPVIQVIGDEDETWGGEFPEDYRAQFPNLVRKVLPGMGHKDAIWQADLFLEALEEVLRERRRVPVR
jgi:pimeloyl-ACP methyl ester carboxylesterase